MLSTFLPLLVILGLSCPVSLFELSSPATTATGEVRAGGAILPLAVGNYWSYRIIEGRRFSDSVTYSIVGTRKIPCGRTAFLFDRRWLLDKDAAYLRDGTLYGLQMGGASHAMEMLVPAEADPGCAWVADHGSHFTFIGEGDTVEVPAGRFVCSRIDVARSAPEHLLSFTMWWAPGVGLVKVGGGGLSMELLAYRAG